MKKRKVLVTGGAGFIGSNIVDRLIAQKHEVFIFDNLSTGIKDYINPKAVFFEGNVSRKEHLEKVFENNLDAVFHIAGCASNISSFSDPMLDINSNFIGTVNVVRKCIEHKISRFLYASSMTVYGEIKELPVKETTHTIPISYYGISKYAAERFVHATAKRKDLNFVFNATSFRMFNVYGKRQSLTNPYQGVMAIFIGNVLRNEPVTIFGDGKQSRDFVHIDDVANAWIRSLDDKRTFGQVYNLGFGKDTSVNQLVSIITATMGKNPKTYKIIRKEGRPGDQRHMRADITKISSLGWKPKIDLKEGLERTIEWART